MMMSGNGNDTGPAGGTGAPVSASPVWFDALRAAFLSLATVVVVAGNVLCFLVAVRGPGQTRKVSRIFLVSLIVADLCTGVFAGGPLLLVAAGVGEDPAAEAGAVAGEALCKVYFLCGILFNGGSFLSLLALIADCYLAIEKPLRYPSLLTARRAYTATAAGWLAMLLLVAAYGAHFGSLPHHKREWRWCLVEVGRARNASYVLTLLLYTGVTVVLPLTATLGLYARIRLLVRRHKSRLASLAPRPVPGPVAGGGRHHHPPHQPPQRAASETRSLTTFLIVNCAAALTSLPLAVLLVYSYSSGRFSMYGLSAAMMLRSCNNLLNVLVHARRNGEFRAVLAGMLSLRRRSPNPLRKANDTAASNTQLSTVV